MHASSTLLLMSQAALTRNQGITLTEMHVYTHTQCTFVCINICLHREKVMYPDNISSCSSFPAQVSMDFQIRPNPGN